MILRWLKTLKHRIYLIQVIADRIQVIADRVDHLDQAQQELVGQQKGALQELADLRRMDQQTHALMAHLQHSVGATLATINTIGLDLEHSLDLSRQATARVESRQLGHHPTPDLKANEFRVYSQFGEDGILQFLFRHIPVANKMFVEFGVEDYRECNTRFLLVNNRWSGLVMDGSEDNMAKLKADPVYWRYNLKALQAFVTVDNINQILSDNGVEGEIGLLSIDIDGNDYWVWEAITVVRPTVVVIEYNYRFGTEDAVVVPYDKAFDKNCAHPSAVYYGASLRALCHLAQRKGYLFVGCSSGGVNAFFVREDKKPEAVRQVSVEDGYVEGQHAEVQDPNGTPMFGVKLVKMPLEEQKRLLMDLPLVFVDAA